MGLFVLLTGFLYQRGSSESKTIEEPDVVDQDPREAAQRSGCAMAGSRAAASGSRSTSDR